MNSYKVEKLTSKSGFPTLQIKYEGKMMLVHSKYDPAKEAEQILDKFRNQFHDYEHVLFYGVGLGYHVKAFMEQYPEKLASTYEPVAEIAEICNRSVRETDFPISELTHAFVEKDQDDLERNLYEFSGNLRQKVLLVILPSYERFFKENALHFVSKFKSIAEEKRITIGANSIFSRRWTLNSLMNLPSTFETPNFLLEHSKTFEDKPVILISAGPSLSEEMENLKLIKEKGLAYLFAVGSANKALIAQGIYPDAVFTFDPQAHNYTVFQQIIDEKIKNIPLVYGTSVGFETVERYPGPKFHFVTSQDTITHFFHEGKLPVINDAYSIAIVTLQILYRLNVGKIILVGQNFAFKNDLFYANEIKRYDIEKKDLTGAQVQKDDLENSFTVPDVNGNNVLTNKSFNNMRLLMEKYILENPHIPVINTTMGGAAIQGTFFISLKQLIENDLGDSVVNNKWYEKGQCLPITDVAKKALSNLQKDIFLFVKHYDVIFEHFKDIERSIHRLNKNNIQKYLDKTDELIGKISRNTLFNIVIKPITRNFFEKLQSEIDIIQTLEPTKEKLVKVVNLFSEYFDICRHVYKDVTPIIQTLVKPKLNIERNEYIATSGVFHYEGDWKKQYLLNQEITSDLSDKEVVEDKIKLPISSVRTTEKNSKFSFKFSGRSLKLYGTNHSKGVLKIKVTIDNKISHFTIKDFINEELFFSFLRYPLFELSNLKSGLHNVVIEIVSDNPDLQFQAIEIEETERAYHIHEVLTVDELEIGKRIRCHYKAEYDSVGEFSGLGEEKGRFLPGETTAEPNGDFYFILVEEVAGEKILIADRNVQHSIDFNNIRKIEKRKVQLNKISASFRLLQINSENDNEWDKYLVRSNLNCNVIPNCELVWHHDRNVDINKGVYSIVEEHQKDFGVCANYTNLSQGIYKKNIFARISNFERNNAYGLRPVCLIKGEII